MADCCREIFPMVDADYVAYRKDKIETVLDLYCTRILNLQNVIKIASTGDIFIRCDDITMPKMTATISHFLTIFHNPADDRVYCGMLFITLYFVIKFLPMFDEHLPIIQLIKEKVSVDCGKVLAQIPLMGLDELEKLKLTAHGNELLNKIKRL